MPRGNGICRDHHDGLRANVNICFLFIFFFLDPFFFCYFSFCLVKVVESASVCVCGGRKCRVIQIKVKPRHKDTQAKRDRHFILSLFFCTHASSLSSRRAIFGADARAAPLCGVHRLAFVSFALSLVRFVRPSLFFFLSLSTVYKLVVDSTATTQLAHFCFAFLN